MRVPKYTNQNVMDAIASSTSIRQVLSKLGLREAGGNYKSIKNLIAKLDIDISHLTGKGWKKDKTFGPKKPIEDYLSNKYQINSHKLRLRLLEEKIFPHQCQCCLNTTWLNQPISLELEHKDGNHDNNNLKNLELLCPNCHSLTPTYRGKNVQKLWLEK